MFHVTVSIGSIMSFQTSVCFHWIVSLILHTLFSFLTFQMLRISLKTWKVLLVGLQKKSFPLIYTCFDDKEQLPDLQRIRKNEYSVAFTKFVEQLQKACLRVGKEEIFGTYGN